MGYDEAWHAILRKAEAGHPWFQARAELVSDTINRHANSSPLVLDAGCGTGWTSASISRSVRSSLVVATDRSTAEASDAGYGGVLLVESDLGALPFRRCFDVLMLLDVLEHFEDDRSILQSAGALIREGGMLVVTVPSMPSLWSSYDVRCGHARRYTRRSLLELLETGGFRPVFTSHFMFFLAPLLLLHRRSSSKAAAAGPSDEAELSPGRFVSSVLRFCLSVEKLFLSKGLSLPWGSSLLVAAMSPRP